MTSMVQAGCRRTGLPPYAPSGSFLRSDREAPVPGAQTPPPCPPVTRARRYRNLGQARKPARVGGRGRDHGEGLGEFRPDLGHVDGIERVLSA